MTNRQVVVLDRDGTINVDRHYLSDAAELEFARGAVAGLQKLSAAGCRLVIITNQSGVGRGYFDLPQLENIHDALRRMLREIGVEIEKIYVCPHAPTDACQCRKPEPGLMELAAKELNFDPAFAFVIGDKESDVQFGLRCGAKAILIDPENVAINSEADFRAADLDEAAGWVLQRASH